MPNIRKLKVCAICGKAEGQHWADHWKKRHRSIEPRELLPGEAPTQPLDSNWIYLIKDKTTKEQFLKGLH
jgi:predicted alpha/beta hydrolase family esterase